MMQIYNRILNSRSLESLELITIIAISLLVVMGILEAGRSRLWALIGQALEHKLDGDVYQAIIQQPALAKTTEKKDKPQPRTQPLHDLKSLKNFVSMGSINIFFDALFAPIFFIALFILHPIVGWVGVGAGLIIFSLAIISEIISKKMVAEASEFEAKAGQIIENSLRQNDAVQSMGMGGRLYQRWAANRTPSIDSTAKSQSYLGTISGLAKSIRLTVQLGILGIGAYLVLTTNEFLAGGIIAASIIMGRALAPIDQSIGMWKQFVTARHAGKRLSEVIKNCETRLPLNNQPKPRLIYSIQDLGLAAPGQQKPLMQNVSFQLQTGNSLAIVGPNGAGKTTLLKSLTGILSPAAGSVRLDGGRVNQLSEQDRNQLFGYLPQDIQLLPGTILDNICRFAEINDDIIAKTYAATELAGCHHLIQNLPSGYQTEISGGASQLSSGQVQLIGLARAIYDSPDLLILDEPTANLDDHGQNLVAKLILQRKEQGLITCFTTHQKPMINICTHLLFISPQRTLVGPRDEIIRILTEEKKQ
jgi:PrtD family type I secretion system ABC transporter